MLTTGGRTSSVCCPPPEMKLRKKEKKNKNKKQHKHKKEKVGNVAGFCWFLLLWWADAVVDPPRRRGRRSADTKRRSRRRVAGRRSPAAVGRKRTEVKMCPPWSCSRGQRSNCVWSFCLMSVCQTRPLCSSVSSLDSKMSAHITDGRDAGSVLREDDQQPSPVQRSPGAPLLLCLNNKADSLLSSVLM